MELSWKRKLLLCPNCGSNDLRGDIPNVACNSCSKKLVFNSNNILIAKVSDNEGVEFHEKMEKGTTLRKLQNRRLHLAYWETPYYKNAIEKWISPIKKDGKIVLDLGCGDGRFTDLLVKSGFEKIIATDCNIESLNSLALHANENGYRNRILIVQSDVQNVPVKQGYFDLVLSIGVLYYLNEKFEFGLEYVNSLIKKGGYLVASEPDLEGCSVKELLFEGVDDFIMAFEKRVFTEINKGEKFKFRTFSKEEIIDIYLKKGFEVLDEHGISLFPSLLRIGKIKGWFNESEIEKKEDKLRELFNYYDKNGKLYKHILRFCRKKQFIK